MKNEYLSYDALQLAAETSFIKWTKKEVDATYAANWSAWLEDHPEMLPVVEHARKIVETNIAAVQPLPHNIDKRALWNRIDASTPQSAPILDKKPMRKSMKLRPLYFGLAIAAAIALFLLIFPFASQTELISPSGKHLAFTLPDSSTIELNAVSTIQYKEKEFAQNREVFLKGEAFFQVEKGDNFTVNTRLGSVKVLGTSFNVYEREESFEVQCLTGKVRVSTSNGKEFVDLLPGETCALNERGKLIKKEISIPSLATWRNYKFHYEKTPLIEVLEEIKRQFNVEIDTRAVNLNEEYTGGFEERNLENVLENVLWPLNLKFKLIQNTVIITEE